MQHSQQTLQIFAWMRYNIMSVIQHCWKLSPKENSSGSAAPTVTGI